MELPSRSLSSLKGERGAGFVVELKPSKCSQTMTSAAFPVPSPAGPSVPVPSPAGPSVPVPSPAGPWVPVLDLRAIMDLEASSCTGSPPPGVSVAKSPGRWVGVEDPGPCCFCVVCLCLFGCLLLMQNRAVAAVSQSGNVGRVSRIDELSVFSCVIRSAATHRLSRLITTSLCSKNVNVD